MFHNEIEIKLKPFQARHMESKPQVSNPSHFGLTLRISVISFTLRLSQFICNPIFGTKRNYRRPTTQRESLYMESIILNIFDSIQCKGEYQWMRWWYHYNGNDNFIAILFGVSLLYRFFHIFIWSHWYQTLNCELDYLYFILNRKLYSISF